MTSSTNWSTNWYLHLSLHLSACPISKKPSRLDVHEYLMFKWQLARTSYILGHWQVKMGKILSIISILVTSSCIGFLILMGSRCVVKLSEELKGQMWTLLRLLNIFIQQLAYVLLMLTRKMKGTSKCWPSVISGTWFSK